MNTCMIGKQPERVIVKSIPVWPPETSHPSLIVHKTGTQSDPFHQ